MVLYGHARKGFEYPPIKPQVITESDIFGQEQKKKEKEKVYNGKRIQDFCRAVYRGIMWSMKSMDWEFTVELRKLK